MLVVQLLPEGCGIYAAGRQATRWFNTNAHLHGANRDDVKAAPQNFELLYCAHLPQQSSLQGHFNSIQSSTPRFMV